jgi:hypothetical protein
MKMENIDGIPLPIGRNMETRPMIPKIKITTLRFFTRSLPSLKLCAQYTVSDERVSSTVARRELFFFGAPRAEIAIASRFMDEPLTAALAEDLLGGQALIPAMSGSIPEMKTLRDRCLAAGFPAIVGCPPGAGKG